MQEFRLIFREKGIERAARQFLRITRGIKHFAFHGEMGAGKTTFITALCKNLGAEDLVSSPTFSIMNEYKTSNDEVLYHFDFYRIKTTNELLDLGFEEYFDSGNFNFIEWPEIAGEVLPHDFLHVEIVVGKDGKRTIRFSTGESATN